MMVNLHTPCLRGICGLDATCEPWLVALLVTVCIPEFCTRAVGCPTVVPMPRSWPEACIWNRSQHIIQRNLFLCERHKSTAKLPSAGKVKFYTLVKTSVCLKNNKLLSQQTSVTQNVILSFFLYSADTSEIAANHYTMKNLGPYFKEFKNYCIYLENHKTILKTPSSTKECMLLSLNSPHTFMVWCLIKNSNFFTYTFSFTTDIVWNWVPQYYSLKGT